MPQLGLISFKENDHNTCNSNSCFRICGEIMKDIACYIFCLIWNIFVLGGAIYLIGWQGWNPWWIALVFFLLAFPKDNDKEEDYD